LIGVKGENLPEHDIRNHNFVEILRSIRVSLHLDRHNPRAINFVRPSRAIRGCVRAPAVDLIGQQFGGDRQEFYGLIDRRLGFSNESLKFFRMHFEVT
jgi:hypothetical protein